MTFSDFALLTRGLIAPWIVGKSDFQAIIALVLILLIILLATWKRFVWHTNSATSSLRCVFVIFVLLATVQIALHGQYAETSGGALSDYSIAVVDGYESSTSLWHSHIVKSVVALLLSCFGWHPSELRGDIGYPFLFFVPPHLVVGYGCVAALFSLAVLLIASNLWLHLLQIRAYLSAVLCLIVSAAVMKMPFDGGIFNGRFAACCGILMFYRAYASKPTFPDLPSSWPWCTLAVFGALLWSSIPLALTPRIEVANWVDVSMVDVLCPILPVAAAVAIERCIARLAARRLAIAVLSAVAAVYSIRALPWYSNDLRFALTKFPATSWISVLEYDVSIPGVTNLAPYPRLTTVPIAHSETGLTLQEKFQLRPGVPSVIQTNSTCNSAPPYRVFVEFREIEATDRADLVLPWYVKSLSISPLPGGDVKRAEFVLSACLPYPNGPPVPLLRTIAAKGSRVFVVRGIWYRGDRPVP